MQGGVEAGTIDVDRRVGAAVSNFIATLVFSHQIKMDRAHWLGLKALCSTSFMFGAVK